MSTPRDERVAGATFKERTVGRGWELFEPIDAAYEHVDIDAAEWHRRIGGIIGPAYLAATDPRGQSGSSSTAADWEAARRFILAAVNRDGEFLDVGCANGHLMECAVAWLAETGYRIEPYGLEILPELASWARQRLPQWADRIATGNAIEWITEQPFDFVRTGLEYVPARLRPELVHHLLEATVARGGRLIIGAHTEVAGSQPRLQAEVESWGFAVAGSVDAPHARNFRVVRRAFWLETTNTNTNAN